MLALNTFSVSNSHVARPCCDWFVSIPASNGPFSVVLSHGALSRCCQDATKQEVTLFPKLLQHLAMLKASPRPNSNPQQLQSSAK